MCHVETLFTENRWRSITDQKTPMAARNAYWQLFDKPMKENGITIKGYCENT